MSDIGDAFPQAFALIGRFDAELIEIIGLSLRVSLSATFIAMGIGAPLGGLLALSKFPGRHATIVLANALLGLPPVVAGLFIYLVLSRSGPLGSLGLLFTPSAMHAAASSLVCTRGRALGSHRRATRNEQHPNPHRARPARRHGRSG